MSMLPTEQPDDLHADEHQYNFEPDPVTFILKYKNKRIGFIMDPYDGKGLLKAFNDKGTSLGVPTTLEYAMDEVIFDWCKKHEEIEMFSDVKLSMFSGERALSAAVYRNMYGVSKSKSDMHTDR